jgi:hypothetical protein
LNPARGAEAARILRALGVNGVLVKAAELGYITEVACAMPRCFCPEELGGARYFERRSRTWSDWEPTHEHFPVAKRDGGKATPDNAILAHRLCNKLDYSISQGLTIEKDLARVEAARKRASPAKPPREPETPGWRSLSRDELAAHLLATPTIADTSWTAEPRLPRESREAFIRRVVLGESAGAVTGA